MALGRWDKYGGQIDIAHGHLSLKDKNGKTRATGKWLGTNLYKMNVQVCKLDEHTQSSSNNSMHSSYVAQVTPKSWETWHHRFGHISYSGLQHLLTKGLVNGFDVDEMSPKPDYQACTEAKHSTEPFSKKAEHRAQKPGQLTHIDVWGKFETESIDGYQYFIGFVDDYGRYITTEGMKKKSEATQKVKNYFAHLHSQDLKLKVIHFDIGGKFLATKLCDWLKQEGIDAQPITLYSPSQNGVVEYMNCMLVELAHTMINS